MVYSITFYDTKSVLTLFEHYDYPVPYIYTGIKNVN